ncbi:UbiD family decarboxylase [Xylaria palmicola]|nr:UbiD family decarboxylase [Xylaria palmicola]
MPMYFAVLTEEVIRGLLENLTPDEAEGFQDVLRSALHEYSTAAQAIDSVAYRQPERASVRSDRIGATTVFMPSTSPLGHGVKVVTLASPERNPSLPLLKPTGSLTLYAPDGNPLGILHAQTLTAFRTALASSSLLMKRTNVRTLTVFGAGLQAYWHIRLALMLRGTTIRTVNIINRRFSENAKQILKHFYSVPAEIKEREGWGEVQFSMLTPGYGEYSRLQKEHIRAADIIYCCTPSTEPLFDGSILTSHEGRRKGRLIVAVGGYARDMRELPTELLIQATRPHQRGHFHFHKHAAEGGVILVDSLTGALKEAAEIIEAGLEPKQLVELGELIMIRRLAQEEEEASSQQSDETDSPSDSIERPDMSAGGSAMSTVYGSNDSGGSKRSLSRSPSRSRPGSGTSTPRPSSPGGLRLPSFRHHRRTSSQQSSKEDKAEKVAEEKEDNEEKGKMEKKQDDHLARWLASGNVIYKSVGLGLMDLVVGLQIIELARAKGVGILVEDFSM